MQTYFVYVVRCVDGTLYTGITTDVERRTGEHNTSPKGSRYTRARRPVQIVYTKKYKNRAEASVEESRIKKLNRQQKINFIT